MVKEQAPSNPAANLSVKKAGRADKGTKLRVIKDGDGSVSKPMETETITEENSNNKLDSQLIVSTNCEHMMVDTAVT